MFKCSFMLESWSEQEKFYCYNIAPWDGFRTFIEEFGLQNTWEKIIYEVEETDDEDVKIYE